MWPWRHGITKAHVDLQRAACGADACQQRDAGAAVVVVLTNGIRLHGCEVEHDPVAQVHGGDFAKSGDQVCLIVGAEAQQVGIPGWAVWGVVPQCKQQSALEQKAVGMRGHAEAGQQALHRKAVQQQAVVVAALPGKRQQSGQDGCRQISAHCVTASR